MAKWVGAGRRGIIEVVTGAGKTVFAQMAIQDVRAAYPDSRAYVVVPTLALLDQWYVSLREDLGVAEADIASFSGEGHAPRWEAVNLLVLNTARTLLAQAPATQSLLIVDECHRAASPENSAALGGDWLATLGMSATPQREHDLGFEEVLVPRLGDVIYQYGYASAVRENVIAPFDLINVRVELMPPEQIMYDRLSRRIAVALRRERQTGRPSDDRLRRLLQRRASVVAEAAMRIPVAAKLVEAHRSERVLVFHERIPAAEAIQRMLAARGVSTAIYHSKMDAPTRRDNLRLYRRGVFPVLITCRALDEGMNVPETTVAIIASSTASSRQRIQRLGRVLRPSAGKASATVYTVYASDLEHRRLMDESIGASGARSVTWRNVRTPKRG